MKIPTSSVTKTVNLGFTIENRAGIDVLVWKHGGCQPATSAEVAMWKSLSAVQQPVVREPLTLQQIAKAFTEAGLDPDDYPDDVMIEPLVRAIEHAHGITQKGGSNAE